MNKKEESENLFDIYSDKTPFFLKEFINTQEFSRLKDIGMHCGCEYTSFRSFSYIKDYSRWEHSIGVALIVWNFTKDMKQTVAALLHDIATPVFSHVIDFLNDDHVKQESTEKHTELVITNSEEIISLAGKYNLNLKEISDYHAYPIADNESPQLSADRLEYHMGNFYCRGMFDKNTIKEIYYDLKVQKNEYGTEELSFETVDTAKKFFHASISNSMLFISDEDRFSMQYLADIIKKSIHNSIINKNDLYLTETEIINKLMQKEEYKKMWENYSECREVIYSEKKPEEGFWVNIPAKKRYVNPLVNCNERQIRLSEIDPEVNRQIYDFLDISFDRWMSAAK